MKKCDHENPSELEAISKEDAIAAGMKWYFTGIQCQNGHVDKRYTNTGICYGCKRDRNSVHRDRYPDVIKSISNRTYQKNRDKCVVYSREWASRNRKKSNAIKKKCSEKYREKYKAHNAARVKLRRKTDPLWRLYKNTSKNVWDSMQSKRAGRSWELCVGYDVHELRDRLESLFRDGMTWENYGSFWELDHIKPTGLCETFKEAWALTNLQPLECSKNRSKSNRYIG